MKSKLFCSSGVEEHSGRTLTDQKHKKDPNNYSKLKKDQILASEDMADNVKTEVILCDMCTEEERKPARKTCMKCEISMCVQHLQAHLTTPVLLQTHPLTEPMALCGTTKCPQHGKLVEYYCLDDLTCVCVSCAIEDQHRLHNMKTFSTAHKELMEKLSVEQQALLGKTDDDNVSLEKWEKRESETLGSASVRLVEAVTNLRDLTLTSVQSSVSARMVAMKTGKASMQAAQNEKDTFRFLQMYAEVNRDLEKAKAVDLRKGLEPGSDRDKLVQEIRENGEKMVDQADHLLRSLLTLVDPEKHQELVAASSDLVFVPMTFGPSMSMSEDKKVVFYNSWLGQCSATLLIHSTKSVPKFHRWMVRLSDNCDWTIGLCDKKSKQNLTNRPVYGLRCKDNQLSSLIAEYADQCNATDSSQGFGLQQSSRAQGDKQLKVSSEFITGLDSSGDEAIPRPELVEVFWNFATSSLSFFSRPSQYQREEIITIKASLNNWDLSPFVQLTKENSQHVPQQNWTCNCGMTYSQTGYNTGGGFHQGNCSCGALIGNAFITELVCELLG